MVEIPSLLASAGFDARKAQSAMQGPVFDVFREARAGITHASGGKKSPGSTLTEDEVKRGTTLTPDEKQIYDQVLDRYNATGGEYKGERIAPTERALKVFAGNALALNAGVPTEMQTHILGKILYHAGHLGGDNGKEMAKFFLDHCPNAQHVLFQTAGPGHPVTYPELLGMGMNPALPSDVKEHRTDIAAQYAVGRWNPDDVKHILKNVTPPPAPKSPPLIVRS